MRNFIWACSDVREGDAFDFLFLEIFCSVDTVDITGVNNGAGTDAASPSDARDGTEHGPESIVGVGVAEDDKAESVEAEEATT